MPQSTFTYELDENQQNSLLAVMSGGNYRPRTVPYSLMSVEGDGFNYVVSPKRKQYITFFNSEADLLSRTNGTSEPTESTQYWSVGCGRIELDTDLYVSVALDATASVEELCEEAKDAVGAGKTAKRIEGNIDYWDKYLAAITIPSDLILASAPEKE